MAFCSNCGHQLVDGAKFCANCGKIINEINSSTQRKTTYDGEIHKCPNCGELMDPFEIKCDTCGYELRSAKATVSVKEFECKLESTKSVDGRIALIKTFAIPNAKEDIYDFFILAISNIEAGGDETDAWLVKLEQTYQKARLLFGSNASFTYFQELYDKAHKYKRKRKLSAFIASWWMCLLGAIVTVIGLYLEIMGNFKGTESGDPDSPYYMLALIALLIMGGGGTLFGLGIKYGISHSKQN
jgi:DNA-directed RNA polymerase subunit M/transcription elongation factor TFIIS